MTEEAKEFFNDLRNFPPEAERKETVINSLNEILKSIGSYLNDKEASFSRKEINGKDSLIYKDTYGEHVQSIAGDDPKAIFIDALKLLLGNTRELRGSYNELKQYFEGE